MYEAASGIVPIVSKKLQVYFMQLIKSFKLSKNNNQQIQQITKLASEL